MVSWGPMETQGKSSDRSICAVFILQRAWACSVVCYQERAQCFAESPFRQFELRDRKGIHLPFRRLASGCKQASTTVGHNLCVVCIWVPSNHRISNEPCLHLCLILTSLSTSHNFRVCSVTPSQIKAPQTKVVLFFKKHLLIYVRSSMHKSTEDGADGEEERTSQGNSLLSTEPDTGFDLITQRSWPEPKLSQILNQLCHLNTLPNKKQFYIRLYHWLLSVKQCYCKCKFRHGNNLIIYTFAKMAFSVYYDPYTPYQLFMHRFTCTYWSFLSVHIKWSTIHIAYMYAEWESPMWNMLEF